MGAQHTPGPWAAELIIHEADEDGPDAPIEWRITYPGAGGFWLATVHIGACGDAPELAEEEANARLIAQAPDLRAFAEQVARMLLDGENEGEGTPYEQDQADAIEALASLITKARELTGIEGPGKPVCGHFQSDGRGCCVNCDHFHGPEGGA